MVFQSLGLAATHFSYSATAFSTLPERMYWSAALKIRSLLSAISQSLAHFADRCENAIAFHVHVFMTRCRRLTPWLPLPPTDSRFSRNPSMKLYCSLPSSEPPFLCDPAGWITCLDSTYYHSNHRSF